MLHNKSKDFDEKRGIQPCAYNKYYSQPAHLHKQMSLRLHFVDSSGLDTIMLLTRLRAYAGYAEAS